jgi:hypothetical protein
LSLTLSFASGAIVGSVVFFGLLRYVFKIVLKEEDLLSLAESLGEFLRQVSRGGRSNSARQVRSVRFGELRLPSISQGMVGLAERRLPKTLSVAERQRWGEEMRADVASLPRWKRFWTAFNIWRKGAPKIPVGAESAARSAGD